MIERTISHYRVVEKLGEGGMGLVYKAHDTHLDRFAAIKVLPPEKVADPERKRRFVQEAKAASALNHPNIVTIYDIDEQDGVDYIAMEYIPGKSLDQLIGRKGLKLGEALKYGVQIADALSRAHAAGIVHRDLKPGNIMVDEHGRVRVLDFGLAKLTETEFTGQDEATRTLKPTTEEGTIVGTVAYMSPEQAEGKRLDTRSDIFSYGSVLYEMVTGRRAFQKDSKTSTLAAILNQEPPVLSAEVPHDLEQVIGRCLRKDPARRYQHMADVKVALEDLKEESESSRLTAQAPAPARRNRFLWPAAGSAGVVVLAVAGFFLWQHAQAKPLTDKDTLLLADFVNTTGDPVFDVTLKQALAVQLEQSPYLSIASDQDLRTTLRSMSRPPDQPVTGAVAREVCERQGCKAVLNGSISGLGARYVIAVEAVNCQNGETLARQQVEAEGKEQVLSAVGKAAAKMRARLGESLSSIAKLEKPLEATTSSIEAFRAYALGMQQRRRGGSSLAAVPFYKRAVELDPNFAMAHSGLATIYTNFGERTQAAENFQKAFGLLNRVSERERLAILSLYYSNFTGEVDKAIETLQVFTKSYPRDPIAFNNLGVQYSRACQFEKALEQYQQALRLDPRNSLFYSNTADEFMKLGRFGEARSIAEKGISQGFDSSGFRGFLFRIALAEGDTAAAARELEWYRGRPEEYVMYALQATQLELGGQFRKVAGSRPRVQGLSPQTKLPARPALSMAGKAYKQAVLGNCRETRELARSAIAMHQDAKEPAALALALCGETDLPEKLYAEVVKEQPLSTYIKVREAWLQAAIALTRNQPAKALELSRPCIPYARGVTPIPYLRGQIYLRLHQGAEAMAEFQQILGNRGVSFFTSEYPAAFVGLARAAAMAGDIDKSRRAYQDFLAFWKDADADIPLLQEARREYEKLK